MIKETVLLTKENVSASNSRKRKTLILVSGGLDSVAALVWLLENTEDLIHVHHIKLFNYENRQKPENDAFQKCMSYIKENYRGIHLETESVISWPEPYCPFDMYSYMFQAGLLVNQYKPEHAPQRICTGSIDEGATDPERLKAVQIRRNIAWSMVKLLCKHEVEWFKPLVKMKKPEVAALLPDELRRMTFSCRKPIKEGGSYKNCGECRPCVNRSGEK